MIASEGVAKAEHMPTASHRADLSDQGQGWPYIALVLALTYFGAIGGSLFARVDFWLQVVNHAALLSGVLGLSLLRAVRREHLRVSAIQLPVVVLPCLLFLSTLTSVDARVSLEQSVQWAIYALFFLLVADALSRVPTGRIVRAQLVAALVVASVAWLEGAAYTLPAMAQNTAQQAPQALKDILAIHRLQLPLGNPNHLGWYMALSLPWLVPYLARKPLKRLRVLRYAVAVASLGGALVLTQSRGAALGLAASLVVLTILPGARSQLVGTKSSLPRWKAAIFAGLLIVGFGLLAYVFLARGFGDAVRAQIWDQALSLIASRPWTGAGPGTFALVFPAFTFGSVDTHEFSFGNAHNLVLQLFTAIGVLGVVAIGVPLVRAIAVVVANWRAPAPFDPASAITGKATPYRFAAVASLAGFMAVGVVDVPWSVPSVVGLAALSLLVLHREASSRAADLRLPAQSPLIAALALAAVAVYFQIGHWFYNQSLSAAREGNWARATTAIEQAAQWDGQNRLYRYEASLLRARLLLDRSADSELLPLAALLESETTQRKLAMDYVNLSWLYWRTGQMEKAVQAAQDAVRRAPADKWARYSAGMMFLQAGRVDQAQVELAQASLEEPRLLESAFWLADPARRRVTRAIAAQAVRLAEQKYGRPVVGPDTARLAITAGMRETVEQYVSAHPDDWGARAIWGYSLLQQGQLERAEDELRAALGHSGVPDEAHFWLYSSLQGQGKFSESQRSLENGAARRDPRSLYVLATQRNQEGAKVAAVALLEEALGSFAVYDWTGERTVLAMDAYSRLPMPAGLFPPELTSLVPADIVPGYLLLSKIYDELGDTPRASRAYEQYQRLMKFNQKIGYSSWMLLRCLHRVSPSPALAGCPLTCDAH